MRKLSPIGKKFAENILYSIFAHLLVKPNLQTVGKKLIEKMAIQIGNAESSFHDFCHKRAMLPYLVPHTLETKSYVFHLSRAIPVY